MATTTDILVLAIILVGLNGLTNGGTVPDDVYVHCGKDTCLKSSTCNAAESKCDCPSGEIGNARFECADAEKQCLCIIQGDPHFHDFSGETFTLPIACAHRIVRFNNPPHVIKVNGGAWYSDAEGSNQASMERRIHINLEFFSFPFGIIFEGNNPPVVVYKHVNPDALGLKVSKTKDAGGFYNVEKVSPWKTIELKVKYNPDTSTFSLLTPIRHIHVNGGLCGTCGKGSTSNPSRDSILQRTLNNLDSPSPINGTSMNIYGVCDTLTNTVHSCPPARSADARRYCGPMLIEPEVQKCLNHKLKGNLNLLSQFERCYSNVCGTTICNSADLFDSCGPKNHKLPSFC